MSNEIHNNPLDDNEEILILTEKGPDIHTPIEVHTDRRISMEAKGLYSLLHCYADFQTRETFVSRARLRDVSGWGKNKLSEHIKELKAFGLLEETAKKNGHGTRITFKLHRSVHVSQEAEELIEKRSAKHAKRTANLPGQDSILENDHQEVFHNEEDNPRSERPSQIGAVMDVEKKFSTMGFPQETKTPGQNDCPKLVTSPKLGTHDSPNLGHHITPIVINDIDIEGENEVFAENQETALSAEEEAAFEDFASKLRKPIRRSSVEEVRADYKARLDEGYSPEDIQAAYEAYIADHRRKNNGDPAIQYIMSAHAFLTEGKGLVAYSTSSADERPKRVDAERASVSTLRAHASNDEVISGLFDSWQRKCYLLSNAGKAMSDEARRRTADAAKGDERSIRNRYAELQSRGKVR